jgi:hypothetical protein
MDETLATKLANVNTKHEAIRQAIRDSGVSVSAGAKIDTLPAKIAKLHTGTHKVTFITHRGVIKEQIVCTGERAIAPTPPVYDVYSEFDYWTEAFTNVTEDIEVGAIYKNKLHNGYYKCAYFITLVPGPYSLDIMWIIRGASGDVTVDYGDGVAVVPSIKDIPAHLYYAGTTLGTQNIERVITLWVSSGVGKIQMYYVNNTSGDIKHLVLPPAAVGSEQIQTDAYIRLESIMIPHGYNRFASSAFMGCRTLEQIVLPNTYTGQQEISVFRSANSLRYFVHSSPIRYGNDFFYSCYLLKSVKLIGASAATMPANAFRQAYALEKVKITAPITVISGYAFYQCLMLNSLDFPSTLTTIDGFNFGFCYSLISVTFRSIVPPTLNASAFSSPNTHLKIYVPTASVNAYKVATNWATLASFIVDGGF